MKLQHAYFREMFKQFFSKAVGAKNVKFTQNVDSKFSIQLDESRARCNSISNLDVLDPRTDSMISTDDAQRFMATFPGIVKDLTEANRCPDLPIISENLEKLLNYTVPIRKPYMGYSVVFSYQMLESPENLTQQNIHLANILGWCAELLCSALYIADDILDASELRSGMPCWYKNSDVGLRAISDALIVEKGLYLILKKYFSDLPCYIPIIELFHDITFDTGMGQVLDTTSTKNGKPLLELFTKSRYNDITKYKAGYVVFKLPVGLAMHLANIHDAKLHDQVNSIFFHFGHLCQLHNDILDCFGDLPTTGKDSNDIRNGKCTWLIVQALSRATPAQMQLLEKNYGQPQPECEEAVRSVYQELDLLNLYTAYKNLIFDMIRKDIAQVPHEQLQDLFYMFIQQSDLDSGGKLFVVSSY